VCFSVFVIVMLCSGFVSCKKKNRNAKNMASAGRGSASLYGGLEAVPPAGSRGRVPGQGGGEAPLKLKAFYCRREQICHSHLSET